MQSAKGSSLEFQTHVKLGPYLMQHGTKHLRLILIAAVLVVNIFVFALLAFALAEAKNRQEMEVRTTVQNLALLLDQSVAASAREIDLSLREVADSLERELRLNGRPDERNMNALLTSRQNWISQLAEIRITDASGTVRHGLDVKPGSSATYRDRPFFITHSSRPDSGLIVSNLLMGRVSKAWATVFSRRYNNPDGSFSGVIAAAVPVTHFARLLSGLDLGPHGVAVLRDADTALVARYPPFAGATGQIGSKGGSKELMDIIASGVDATTYHSSQTADGVERTSAYRRLSAMPLYLVVGKGADDYLAQWRSEVKKATAFAAFFLAITIFCAWMLWRLIVLRERADKRSQLLLENASDGIHVLDGDGVLVEANKAFLKMLGYDKSIVGKLRLSDWETQRPLEALKARFDELIARHGQSVFETQHRRSDGSILNVEINVSEIEIDGKHYVYAASRDITERKAAEESIKTLAFYDAHTQLPNRRLLHDRLTQTMASSKRDGSYAALMFLDLDNFKPLNDAHGHAVGDLLLIEAANRLKNCVREVDTVARFGGDEFVVILSDLNADKAASTSQAEIVAEKIRDTLSIPYLLPIKNDGKPDTTVEHHCTVSLGVVLFINHEASEDDILKWADMAMFEAKDAGRNSVRFYRPKD